MDPISIGIIVTVLSLGTALLFLFKADFNKSKRTLKTLSSGEISPTINCSKKAKNKNNNLSQSHSHANVKQQISSSNSRKSAQTFTSSTSGENLRSTKTSTPTEGEKKSLHSNIPDLIVDHEIRSQAKQPSNSNNKMVKKKSESKPAVKLFEQVTSEFEPTLDELDTSIAIEFFNHSNTKQSRAGNKSAKRHTALFAEECFETLESGDRSTSPSYCSEKLFTIIAASNLSKDEVEFAVEMLLNKIESGVSDWKKPKNDPVERLRSQLRENEQILSIEIQNHEQTRARLVELKSQLQSERQLSNKSDEELLKLRKELSVANLALEQSRADLSQLQSVIKQRDEESAKVISRLEQERIQFQATIIANDTARGGDFEALRAKYDEKLIQLQRYELSQQNMNERISELESKLRQAEHLADDLRASKQHDDYEASAKISELKSDRIQLDKALKDQMTRFKDVSEANNLLGKTINELRLINTRQDEMLKQITGERQIHEASMKRTLQEMELELKELQRKLNANTIPREERFHQHQDGTANQAGAEREQKLISEMNQLREVLTNLFPEASVKSPDSNGKTSDWVREYLAALKQLSKTLEEFKEPNNNIDSDSLSPKRQQMIKASTSPRKNTPSPNSNGRSSRASTYHGHKNDDKKLQETKLLEVSSKFQLESQWSEIEPKLTKQIGYPTKQALALFCLRCLD